MIILFVQDILKDALENNMVSPAELPYFEGDFWPNVLEETIKELEQEEEEERRKREEAEAAAAEVAVEQNSPGEVYCGDVSIVFVSFYLGSAI